MKTIFNKLGFFLLFFTAVLSSCKKDPVMYAKGIESFKIKLEDASGVAKEYVGVINEGDIVVTLPTEADVTDLKPIFKTDNPRTIVQVGNVVQESGVSEQDFTNTINYKVKAEDKSTRTYAVSMVKKIAIKSFGFYKEDNAGLPADYVGVIKGLNIEVALNETVALSNLVARFTTTNGVTLKVGGVEQQSKVSANNYESLKLEYQLFEPSLATPYSINVNISFLGKQWELFGENLTIPTATSPKIAINPITNAPYFVYQRTGKDESGVSIDNDRKTVAVMGYVNEKWQNLGDKLGVSDFRADAQSIAFNSKGDLYIGYKDYLNNDQRATVKKYNGAGWDNVGTARFTPMKIDFVNIVMSSDDEPVLSMMKQSTSNEYLDIPQRGAFVMNYKNNAWSDITGALKGRIMAQNQLIRGLDGRIYLALMDRTTGSNKLSMYKFDQNVWTAVGPTSFLAPDGIVGFITVSIAVDKTGQPYLAYQSGSGANRKNHVMKFNGTAWQEIGNGTLSGSVSDNFAICVDKDDNLYFAYANATSLVVKTLNKQTNNWNTERKIIGEKVTAFDIQAAPNGVVYVVASLSASSKTVAYKY